MPQSKNHEPQASADSQSTKDVQQPGDEPFEGSRYTAADERRLLRAGARLLTAMQEYQDEAFRYTTSPTSCLALDEAMMTLGGLSRDLETDLIRLQQAIGMIEEGTQIAPKSARGVAWKPYLDPRGLMYFADLAKPEDPGYLQHLHAWFNNDDGRELDVECGRPTRTGDPCRAIPVYWPSRGRNSACTRHLTPSEKASLEDVWSEIELTYSCPGCLVDDGQPCDENAELKVRPNGQWPRIRGFAGRKMHDARLELYVPPEE